MNEIRPESYWTHLYWLTVLEEQKSYTRAAEKLAVSKSAISQKISELERITGKKLVHRTTRNVTLSEDGLRLVAELNEPFGQLRDILPVPVMKAGRCGERYGSRRRSPFPVNSWYRRLRHFCTSTRSCNCSWR